MLVQKRGRIHLSSELYDALGAARPGKILFDISNDKLVWDDRSLEIFGLTREQFAGTYAAWERMLHEDDRDAVAQQVESALESASELSLRYRIRRPDQSVRHVWAVASIERDPQGEPSVIVGLHLDETEIHRLEAASSLRLEVLNSITEGVCVSRANDGRIIYANPGLARLFGSEPSGFLGRNVDELVLGESELRQTINAQLEEADNWLGEIEFVSQAQAQFWASVSVTTLEHFEYGRLLVWIVHDLRRPNERDRAPVTDHDQVSTIYDSIADAVFAVGMPSRRIQYGNRAVSEMFGYAPDEYIGRTTAMFYTSDEAYQAFGEGLRQAFLSGENQARAEREMLTKDGHKIWVSINTTFVTQGGQLSQVISVLRDISEQKELERQLHQAVKMEAIGNLAGGVAHDINNVLGAVLALGSVLQDEMSEELRWSEDVGRIVDAAQRGKALVENLLMVARKGSPASELVALDDEIGKVVALLKYSIPKNIQLDTTLGAPGQIVEGDRAQLGQTVLNLCVNARDALSDGGRVSVTTRALSITEPARHGDLPPGEYYEIRVSDNGHGMSPDVLKRALDPFFTTKGIGKGTGLGLSTAHSVVQRHRGVMTIESESGAGTTVSIWLPLASPSRSASLAAPAAAKANSLCVLVIDDEEMLRASTKRVLDRLGHAPLLADCGEKGVAVFSAHAARIDVVLLDLSMPDMDGRQCLQLLREIDPSIPVIVATGHWEAEECVDPTTDRVTLLHKPFSLGALRDALARAKLN